MEQHKSEVIPRTLRLLVLKTLETLRPLHGYGIAQVSGNLLQLNQGTLYPALFNLEQTDWIGLNGVSRENNRRAK